MDNNHFVKLILVKGKAEARNNEKPSDANFLRVYKLSNEYRRVLRERQDAQANNTPHPITKES